MYFHFFVTIFENIQEVEQWNVDLFISLIPGALNEVSRVSQVSRNNNNNNNNLFIYSVLFNVLGDQKCITTINNLKTIQKLEVYKYI